MKVRTQNIDRQRREVIDNVRVQAVGAFITLPFLVYKIYCVSWIVMCKIYQSVNQRKQMKLQKPTINKSDAPITSHSILLLWIVI